MDSWTPQQLRLMAVGGNRKLRDFFARYQIYSGTAISFKYTTVAAKFYREALRGEAEGRPFPARLPSAQEGQQACVERSFTSSRPLTSVQNQNFEQPEAPKTWWDSARGALSTAASYTSAVSNRQAAERLPDIGMTDKLKSAAGFVVEKTVDLGGTVSSYMVRTRQPGVVTGAFTQVGSWTLGAYNSAAGLVSSRRGNVEPDMSSSAEYQKMGDAEEPPYRQSSYPAYRAESLGDMMSRERAEKRPTLFNRPVQSYSQPPAAAPNAPSPPPDLLDL
jgi:hypothetical protein